MWSPYTGTDVNLLESVQSKFMRRLAYLNGTPLGFYDHDYSLIKQQFEINSLENRRIIADSLFLFKVLTHSIDCPYITANIGFHVPARALRQNRLFAIPNCRTSLAENSLINKVCTHGNCLCDHVDFFDIFSYSKFLQFLRSRY